MKWLLLTPPMTQLNTPYPATAYLCGQLKRTRVKTTQVDASIDWFWRLMSAEGLQQIAERMNEKASSHTNWYHRNAAQIKQRMPAVLSFLSGSDPSLVARIASRRFLPEGPRFSQIGPSGGQEGYLDWAFGVMGLQDRAKYFASLWLDDIADAIKDGVDPAFAFVRYGESIAASQPKLSPVIEAAMKDLPTLKMLDTLTLDYLSEHQPEVVGMSLPFAGNVVGALRMAITIKRHRPSIKVVWGGGYINTELRELSEPGLFDYVDALTYDDGEQPLVFLDEYFAGARPVSALRRTRLRDGYLDSATEPPLQFSETSTPTYAGLPLDRYLSIVEVLNPMHRLWSDARWNKLTVAHGCYWKKCAFCDVSLDYIARYQPLGAKALVDRMETMMKETGLSGFHFVDEAAPPAALEAMADEIVARGLSVSWWGNIRFEKKFDRKLCQKLAQSGCIAVTGGLEVASNRLLERMQKGVTVEQVARVTKAFNDAGILAHAYLMYGFPTQSAQETVDSLEMVRQLFNEGCLDSAFWHRFSTTVHSPVGKNPEQYQVTLHPHPDATFAKNDVPFEDPTGTDHAAFGPGLAKAVYNFMHGMGLDEDVRQWFCDIKSVKVPKTKVAPDFIAQALRQRRAD